MLLHYALSLYNSDQLFDITSNELYFTDVRITSICNAITSNSNIFRRGWPKKRITQLQVSYFGVLLYFQFYSYFIQ